MIDTNSLQKGEILTLTQYLTVDSIEQNGRVINARNRDGVLIRFENMDGQMTSASQFTETEKAGKNRLAEVLQGAGDKAFTVSFNKQDGTERILTGKFISSEPNLGRTKVIDLNVGPDDRTKGHRQVDNREINWVVLDGKRYVAQ